MQNRLFPILYLTVSIIDIFLGQYLPEGRFFSKPLLMVILLIYFLKETKESPSKRRSFFTIALCFAWLGDVFLLFKGATYFQLGLGSFLFMQLIYIYLFKPKNIIKSVFAKPSLGTISELVIFILIISFQVVPILKGAKLMILPVLIYFLAISTMVLMAKFKEHKTYFRDQDVVYLGAIFFFFSDYFIAHNAFIEKNTYFEFLIIPTYVFAQFCITYGMIDDINTRN